MAFVCPVCNAFETLESACPRCQSILEDQGRLENFFDDYSPYLEMEWTKEVNGYPDIRNHQCMHYLYCPNCSYEQIVAVNETNYTASEIT